MWADYGYSFVDIQQLTPQILYNTANENVKNMYQHATTLALSSIIACQAGNLFVCRSEYLPFWKMSFGENKLLLAGLAAEISIMLSIVYLPFLMAIFLTRPLTLRDLAFLALCPVLLIIAEELRRYVVGKKFPVT